MTPPPLTGFRPAALPCPPQPQLEAPPSLTSPRSSANSSEVLCRIQSYSDEPLIEFSSIEFCRNEDGSIVELGSGAFSTVCAIPAGHAVSAVAWMLSSSRQLLPGTCLRLHALMEA